MGPANQMTPGRMPTTDDRLDVLLIGKVPCGYCVCKVHFYVESCMPFVGSAAAVK